MYRGYQRSQLRKLGNIAKQMAGPTFSGEERLVSSHRHQEREEEDEEGGEGSLHVAPQPGELEPAGASRDQSGVSQALAVSSTKHWKSDKIFRQSAQQTNFLKILTKTRFTPSLRFRCC